MSHYIKENPLCRKELLERRRKKVDRGYEGENKDKGCHGLSHVK